MRTSKRVGIVPNNEPIDTGSRREFVRKLAYIAPAIVTLRVAPSFAKAGSIKCVPLTSVRPAPCNRASESAS